MKKGIVILVCLILIGCTTDCPDCSTPVPFSERKEIPPKFKHEQVEEVGLMIKDNVSQNGYFSRIVDYEAGVVCWYILSNAQNIGLGCLPAEEIRLFE